MLSSQLNMRVVAILKGRFATICSGGVASSCSDNSKASAHITSNLGLAISSSSFKICTARRSFSTAITRDAPSIKRALVKPPGPAPFLLPCRYR